MIRLQLSFKYLGGLGFDGFVDSEYLYTWMQNLGAVIVLVGPEVVS